MKKLILLFLVLIMMPMVANAHDIEVKNADGVTIYYNYINEGKELEVTFRGNSYRKSTDEYRDDIVIPSNVTYMDKTYKVTNIGNNAFYYSSGLTSVTIGNNVISIGNSAFYHCVNLTSVIIGNNVMSIGSSAFGGCTGLTSVMIPNSVTSIGSSAFGGCTGLTSVIIPNSMTSIGAYAFTKCSGLTSITIPNSVTNIGECAFNECSSLTSIEVDSNNPVYDSRDNCNAIIRSSSDALLVGCASTIIPNSVTSIEESAFSGCSGLTSIIIPNSVKTIRESAFTKCSGLTSITIPNSVTNIGIGVFAFCSALVSIKVDDNNSVYDSRGNCNAIIETSTNTLHTGCMNTIIPATVTSIGQFAFYGYSGLTSIVIPNSVTSIVEYAFYSCYGLTSVTISNNVTRVGSNAFNHCSGLTSIIIGNSVTSIGANAFDGVNLPIVVSLIENPFTINGKTSGNRTFSQNTFNNATLYVPKGTIDKYKATDGWKDFVNIIEFTPTGIKVIKNTPNKNTIIYDLNGVRQSEAKKGVNIINGRKVIVK